MSLFLNRSARMTHCHNYSPAPALATTLPSIILYYRSHVYVGSLLSLTEQHCSQETLFQVAFTLHFSALSSRKRYLYKGNLQSKGWIPWIEILLFLAVWFVLLRSSLTAIVGSLSALCLDFLPGDWWAFYWLQTMHCYIVENNEIPRCKHLEIILK